jgi:hypothetical protein
MNNGCFNSSIPNEYITGDFLNNDLLQLLPDGYDVCYITRPGGDITFYLYDSTIPLNEFHDDLIIGYISFDIIPDENEIFIRWLGVNENMKIPFGYNEDDEDESVGFKLRDSGFGTYLLLLAALYAKSRGINIIKLEDFRDQGRDVDKTNNIYTNIGLKYEDGPEMKGNVDTVVSNSNIDSFIETRGEDITDKLDELKEWFDDEEYEVDEMEEYDDDDLMEEYEVDDEMEEEDYGGSY